MDQVEVVLEAHASLGEGPCWDERESVLWWVDILAQSLHRYHPATGSTKTFHIPSMVSAVAPRRSGGLVIAQRDGYYGFDPGTEAMRLLAPVEADLSSHRINDAKCDARGRLWGGTMAYDEEPGAGSFYRFDERGLRLIWGDITCSNGIGWSPDGRRMYYVDSGAHRVDVCDFDVASGEATGRRPFALVPQELGEPDGLTVDAEGFVWVALWAGAALHRYTPEGHLDRVVRVPSVNVTSCTFGGDDLATLYITSATSQASPDQLAKRPLTGSLFALRPGVAGLPTNSFAG